MIKDWRKQSLQTWLESVPTPWRSCLDMKLIYRTQPRHKGPGFLDFIATIVGAAPGASEGFQAKRHSGSCDGNCANCPPHYGYRFGRWYHGHDHVYGCGLCGNYVDGSDYKRIANITAGVGKFPTPAVSVSEKFFFSGC